MSIVMYGPAPVDNPWRGPFEPAIAPIGGITIGPTLFPCLKCNRHIRPGEPCPFCTAQAPSEPRSAVALTTELVQRKTWLMTELAKMEKFKLELEMIDRMIEAMPQSSGAKPDGT